MNTGLRVEVRAKMDLKIRMSDAPNNPDRVWDAGLRDDDLVAFITCFDADHTPTPADIAVFFPIKDSIVQLSPTGVNLTMPCCARLPLPVES